MTVHIFLKVLVLLTLAFGAGWTERYIETYQPAPPIKFLRFDAPTEMPADDRMMEHRPAPIDPPLGRYYFCERGTFQCRVMKELYADGTEIRPL